ncbi:PhoH family protein [Alkalilimnicola ehrlichii MLHE-1]|uniref:PhoH family protein n=1 Tax=Alkalilimnicola ehrlichii (strain ATCC BAA-1101 / DSM 17681 / MLHE-1) TaxID=187272 RepID=Q0A5R6_ALKEH|nr:PhoH family protein [Alkalilimnicola ehrlichii]ABI57821.1 PhoH family protein [Alkalilimnicola ehrlichii MLHE-1]
MINAASAPGRLYVLDTSVLIHDPTALFRFQEHGICLPMAVLTELDAAKQGHSDIARSARQASRFLDGLLSGTDRAALAAGVPLVDTDPGATGRLWFHNADDRPGDSGILASADQLTRELRHTQVTLVSKDVNLRVRALASGLRAEDYRSDRVTEDLDLLQSGIDTLPDAVWTARRETLLENGQEGVRIPLPEGTHWFPGQCLHHDESGFEGIVRQAEPGACWVEPVQDFRGDGGPWGVRARNQEQNFALNLLMDPEIDFVSLLGPAGTGKTLLTLAAGLEQTLELKRFVEIVMTRATIALGEDIGYLPGSEEEKMTPWMGALADNLEVLGQPESGGDWGRAATADLVQSRIKLRSLAFMRGRTFVRRLLILDEAQNLTSKQMKALITRAGPGTKVVCMGNLGQIDTPYLTESSSGLSWAVQRLRDWPHSGHITLQRGERSRLADFANEAL